MYSNYARLRDERKLTDYRVAKETGIARSTFSEWKLGRSKPKIDKLQILAGHFGVSIEYFLQEGGKDNDKNR